MALVLTREDGTGLPNANSYASVADGDSYHEGHLYASAWTGATVDKKTTALVMATRLIDAECQFLGFRSNVDQALQWPRVQVSDREAGVAPQYLASDSVPKCVINATAELARELLLADRTAAPQGEGLKSSAVSGSTFVFDKYDRRPVLTEAVEALLRRVLAGSPGKSTVRLVRS